MATGNAGTAPGPKAPHLPAQGRLDGHAEHEVVPVLRGILLAACQLTGASFGVILLGDSPQHVTHVVSAGTHGEDVGGLGEPHEWGAYFAALLEAAQPLLVNDVPAHRAAYSMPPRHPDTMCMLGAPVHLRAGSYGYLYVANTHAGERFAPGDERSVVPLAAAAGLAVDTDRLVGNRPRRRCWLNAITELIHLLHGESGRDAALQAVAALLKEAVGADASVIALVDPIDPERHVMVEAAAGLGAELVTGARLPRSHFLAEVMDNERLIVSDDVGNDVRFTPPVSWVQSFSVLGPGLVLPLTTPAGVLGVMFVSWRRDSPLGADVGSISTLAIPFAQAAGLVLHQHEAYQIRIRQQRWMDAAAGVTRLLLDEVDPHEVMSEVTRQIREVSGAAYAAVALTDHVGPQDTVVFDVIEGLGLEYASGKRFPCPSPLAVVLETGEPIVTPDIVRDQRYDPPPAWREVLSVLGLVMFMPLRTPHEVHGALIVGWRRGSPEERAARTDAPLVETFADEVALSLQRVHAKEDRDRRQGWLDACRELTRRLAGDLEPDALLRRVIWLLRKVSGADFTAIILPDPADGDAMSAMILEAYGEHGYSRHQMSPHGLVAAAIESGRILVSEDFTREEGYDPPPEIADRLSVVGLGVIVPLVASGEVLGALFAGWRRGSPHERAAMREAALVETFADQAAIALQRGRALHGQNRSERWLEATAEMARLLIGEIDRDDAIALVIRELREVSGADFGGVIIIDPTDPSILRVVDFQGPGIPPVSPDARIPRGGLVARVVATGRRIVSHDYPHLTGHDPPAEWRKALSDIDLGMVMPLIAAEGEVMGVLFAAWRRGSPDEPAAQHEAQEVQTFADLAALALQRVRAQDDRERLRLLEDHGQIAHNLHDTVLQRLFAVGLGLHSATAASTEPAVQQRVRQAIDDLEETTDRVRWTIERLSSDTPDDDH
jgi:GAF domain-containing protein